MINAGVKHDRVPVVSSPWFVGLFNIPHPESIGPHDAFDLVERSGAFGDQAHPRLV